MGAKWLLGRAAESGAVAMDAKRLLGRAGKSGQSCCVARASPGRVMPDIHSIPTNVPLELYLRYEHCATWAYWFSSLCREASERRK